MAFCYAIKLKSRDLYVAHSISSLMMLSFNPSKVPFLILSDYGLVIPSQIVESNMSSSPTPSDIPLLSNR